MYDKYNLKKDSSQWGRLHDHRRFIQEWFKINHNLRINRIIKLFGYLNFDGIGFVKILKLFEISVEFYEQTIWEY